MPNLTIAAAAVLATAGLASADVADSAAGGFTVTISMQIRAKPADVYSHLIQVGDWWNSAHTFSGSSRNLSIEAKPAGCFCEKLSDGGVRHMEVVFVASGKALKLTGALGPLQSIAATGNLNIELSPADAGTKLDVTYAVAGYLPAGMNTWATPVDGVLTEQFTRLKNLIERGNPAPK